MDARTERFVRDRASGYCEYCMISDHLHDQPFHIDHIMSRKHGGSDELNNLAYACLDCNLHKGTDIAGLDTETNQLVRLFDPRLDAWADHFAWQGPLVEGRSAIGRVTVRLLQLNQPMRVATRSVLMAEGVFPPR